MGLFKITRRFLTEFAQNQCNNSLCKRFIRKKFFRDYKNTGLIVCTKITSVNKRCDDLSPIKQVSEFGHIGFNLELTILWLYKVGSNVALYNL